MKLNKFLALVLALVLVVGTFAVSASASTYPGTPGDDCLTLYITMEPTSLSTLSATYGEEFKVLGDLDAGLTQTGDDDTAVPSAAESWEISEDGLVYTFHLREGALWSNGDPVVASDFAFAWKMLMTPETGAEYAYFAYQLIANGEKFYNGECDWEDVGVNVIDDYTLEVTLANPTAYALDMFGFRSLDPINEKFFNEVGAENYNMAPEYFCSNGAFVMESWTHDAEIILKKNPNYFDADKVSLETLTFKILTQSDTKLNSFKAGEIDEIDLTGDQLAAMNAEGYPTNSYLGARTYWILFNTNDEYMSNVNLRKAIDCCYSREDFVAAIIKDDSQPANTFCPPPVMVNGSSFAEQAMATLEADGYLDEEGYLRNPKAQPEKAQAYLAAALEELGCTVDDLSAHLDLHCSDSDESQNQAAFIQEAIRQVLGIEISVTPMQTKAQSAERTSRNYVMDLAGWGADYNDPMTFQDLWVTGAGNNSTDWSNAEYDACIADALTSVDGEQRLADFVRCEELVADECPISPIYYRAYSYAVSEKITGGYHYTAWNSFNFKFATVK